jgi:hypothetical protein
MLILERDPWFEERCKKANAHAVLSYDEAQRKEPFLTTVRSLLGIEPRIPLRAPVKYYLVESRTQEIFTGESVDLSMSGILLLSQKCLVDPGMLVDLKIEIQPPLFIRGEVVRILESSQGYRIAIAFRQFRKGDRPRLRSLIYGRSSERGEGEGE